MSRNRLFSIVVLLSMTCLGIIGGLVVSWVSQQDMTAQQGMVRPITYPQPVTSPAQGVFLVASRQMSDPRFQRSVILLLTHGEEGTLGLIINRPTSLPLSEALPELGRGGKKHQLFFGGPVAMNTLLFLIHSKTSPAHATSVFEDVYVSANRATLEQLLGTSKSVAEIRLYFGHAGWAPGQLNAELATGSWQLFQADVETLFHEQVDTLWEKFIGPANQIMVRQQESCRDRTPVAASLAGTPATLSRLGLPGT